MISFAIFSKRSYSVRLIDREPIKNELLSRYRGSTFATLSIMLRPTYSCEADDITVLGIL